MKKFLVVGCGGSGGATLSYLMDQLQSDLGLHGIDKLPAGWQFVHVDVPVGSRSEADGLGSVDDLGGSYYGSGATGISYSVLDDGVSQRLLTSDSLDKIATWAPRTPSQVGVAISEGAGQYRAVGRMIALSRAKEIRQTLQNAWDQLTRVETNSEMRALDLPGIGAFDDNEAPVVLVVSSMAGGAGASMALDIARILTQLPGLDPHLLGMFMVSADIFDQLPEAARSGVRSNSLAMLGEIVATQAAAAWRHDADTLQALGMQNGQGEAIPFQRVFPIGRFSGAQRTLFGDGSQQAVYRGLGRGLAALMTSGSASNQFVSYDLTNTGGLTGRQGALGWGVAWDTLQWGSFGFSSLSMGRERYREYSAQRLARTSADRLLFGHLQAGSTASADQQVTRLLDSQWSRTMETLGLPAEEGSALDPRTLLTWFTSTAAPRSEMQAVVRGLAETHVSGRMPQPGGVIASQWLDTVAQRLREGRSSATAAIASSAAQWAHTWQQAFVARLMTMTEEATATFGLAYATALLQRVERHLANTVVRGLHELSLRGRNDIAQIDTGFGQRIAAMKGVIVNGAEVFEQLNQKVQANYGDELYGQSAALAEQVMADALPGVVTPLIKAVGEGHALLTQSHDAPVDGLGLARLETDLYRAWPSDDDLRVPARFDVANNEVLLTRSTVFPSQYEADVRASLGSAAATDYAGARATVVGQIVTGDWRTTGAAQPPRGLLTLDVPWRSRTFTVNPFTNQVEAPLTAQFSLHVRATDILSRSRQFVGRPRESFDNFCTVSLKQYVLGADATEVEIQERRREITTKFREALTLARPLVSVDATAVQRIHNRDMEYRYKFSEVPFSDVGPVADQLVDEITRDTRVDQASRTNIANALTSNDAITRIDIFGSYPNYSPVVFDSVLEPVAQEWSALPAQGRSDWWKWRRARPLTASLPMGEAERRAMVGGWFIGQIVGDIVLPDEPFTSAVRIWNAEKATWASFPNPLLTPPSEFKAQYDWMPAVLESSLIAVARAHEAPVLESFVPYTLLRSLYDAAADRPTTGIQERASHRSLANWIASGAGAAGRATSMAGVTPGATPAERAALATKWLSGVRDLAGVHYLHAGQAGAPGGGQFSSVTSRAAASATPLFRDLAEDVYVVAGELIAIVDRVRDEPYRAVTAGGASTSSGPTVDESVIQIPDGGVF